MRNGARRGRVLARRGGPAPHARMRDHCDRAVQRVTSGRRP
ncbi:hypothetical protein F750_5757 [Streptomyces sp. PAMC 26508]|nr:hypothetical protein F750_5757 [Streptomyces sp. PAMC 26508]